MLESISLRGLLSFGWEKQVLPLRPLNLLIGANGSGKSNLIDALTLLGQLPDDFQAFLSERGGAAEWLHKGIDGDGLAEIEVDVADPTLPKALRYLIQLRQEGQRLVVAQEQLATAEPHPDQTPFLFVIRNGDSGNVKAELHLGLGSEESDPLYGSYRWQALQHSQHFSILNHRGRPLNSQIAALGETLRRLQTYPHWVFGPLSVLRQPQAADQRDDRLGPLGQNLALVLSRLRQSPPDWQRLLDTFRMAYEQVRDVEPLPQGGNKVMIFVNEGGYSVPATRLSDGTLRWLFLATLLCDPKPPPLICLEEPEMGLHPDLIRKLAELLKDAAERTQLVVTTHSVELISEFSETPEDVVVCERPFGATLLRRLAREPLQDWLKDYQLGRAWQAGALGGNRF